MENYTAATGIQQWVVNTHKGISKGNVMYQALDTGKGSKMDINGPWTAV